MRKQDERLIIHNVEIYNYYRERLVNLALSQFQWSELPETCDRLYFEKSLLFNGKAAMYKPTGTDFWLSTDYLQKGSFDAYGYPTKINGITFNAKNVETDEWMILYDNMTRATLMPKIDFFARLLWEVHNTYRSNLQQQITPYVIMSDKNKSLSIKNLFNRFFGFQPVIEVKSSFNIDDVKTIDTRVDFKGTELLDNLQRIWAMALSELGITAETTKKERLISDELTINRQEDIISLNSRLLNRVEFCNKMNKKYGMNLSVNLSSQDIQFKSFSDVIEDNKNKVEVDQEVESNG